MKGGDLERESDRPYRPRSRLGPWEAALISSLKTRGLIGVLGFIARRLLTALLLLQIVGMLLVWLALTWFGERNVTTAFLLYLPPALWFLPVPALLIPAFFFNRWGAISLSGLSVLLAVVWLDYGVGPQAQTQERQADEITVLTFNRGQQGKESLQPFKNATKPDLLALQDAGGRANAYLTASGYEEFAYGCSSGEHTLLSRKPILEAARLGDAPGDLGTFISRFVVDWDGTQVAVYSIHMPTPRNVLQYYRRGAFLYGVIGLPGTPFAAKRRLNQQFWDGQIAIVEHLLAAVRNDPLPALIVGDFNAPSVGWIYRRLCQELVDSHAAAGRGFGFTFPGKSNNPLSLGGPWLRIDYVFASPDWEVVASVAEADRGSQHRAVAATLRLQR